MTKQDLIYTIAELKYPGNRISQSLEIRRIQRCNYRKFELILELQEMPEYISFKRAQKLDLLGI